MPILRINQHPTGVPNRYRADVSAEIPNFQPPSFSRDFEFPLSPQDRERIRWYLEDFLQFDEEPAPTIAMRVEALMAERGERCSAASLRARTKASNCGHKLRRICRPPGSKSPPALPRRRLFRGS